MKNTMVVIQEWNWISFWCRNWCSKKHLSLLYI